MALLIRLKQYKNATKSSYGKWYADTVHVGEVHTEEIARRVSENTTFRPGEVKGLIDELVAEMKQQLQDSRVVVLDGFGRFRLTVESEGAETPGDFHLQRSIRKISCKFLASGWHDTDTRRDGEAWHIQRNFSKGAKVEWWVDARRQPKQAADPQTEPQP